MKGLTVTYRRVRNLGNYESAALEVQVEVPEGEDVQNVYADAKHWVEENLAIVMAESRGAARGQQG